MRLSDLSGKEVINLADGARLGCIEECDLVFEGSTGLISALVLPKRGWLSSLWHDGRTPTIPWKSIRRIGDEVIIVDMNNSYENMFTVFRQSN
jgi:YlmC/YmxH family sporulation protein